jgi:cobalt/nickel transport system permease protein
MTIVLTLQALLLGDGGLLALGCNVINMGLAPSLLVAIVKRSGLHDSRHATLLVGAIAFVATMLGAGFISLEVACGRDASELGGWTTFAGRMFAAHACVGLLEGLATMAIVTLLASAKHSRNAAFRLSRPQVVAVAIASLALILVSLPQLGIASAAPDAYQASLAEVARAGYALGDIESPDRLSGIATAAQSCQDALTLSLPEPLMAALGALLAGGGACLGGLLLSRRPTPLAG